MKVKKLKMSPEKIISLFLFFFFIFFSGRFQVNATNARPIQVAWRDAEGSQEVPLESLHGIVARDTPLCLALLRLEDFARGERHLGGAAPFPTRRVSSDAGGGVRGGRG